MLKRPFFRIVTAALVVGIIAAIAMVRANAIVSNDPLIIRQVDTRGESTVKLSVMRPSGKEIAPLQVKQNGVVVDGEVNDAAGAGVPVGVVFVVDVSDAAVSTMESVKETLKATIAERRVNETFAIIATSSNTNRVVTGFTTDARQLNEAVDQLRTGGARAFAPGLSAAAATLRAHPVVQPNIVAISASTGGEAADRLTMSLSDARTSGATVFAAGTRTSGTAIGPMFGSLVRQTGGKFVATPEQGEFTAHVSTIISALRNQVVVSYETDYSGPLEIEISDGQGVVGTTTSMGMFAQGAGINALNPVPTDSGGFLGTPLARVVLALMMLMAAGTLVYGVGTVLSNHGRELTDALQFYRDELDDIDAGALAKLADSQIMKKAVASTTKIAADRGFLEKVEDRLVQADLKLNPGEALFGALVFGALGCAGGLAAGGLLGLLVAGLATVGLPIATLLFMAKRRRMRFTGQLPSTLEMLSSTLRSGFSLPQGLHAIAEEVPEPMSVELKRAMTEERLGRPIIDSLQEISERMHSVDFEWAVLAIRIQSQVGGNLAELLTSVAQTMVARERLRREVRALTAEGRLSAIILVGLPPSISGIIFLLNPGYIVPLFESLIGQLVVGAGVVSIIIGWIVMQKIIDIKA